MVKILYIQMLKVIVIGFFLRLEHERLCGGKWIVDSFINVVKMMVNLLFLILSQIELLQQRGRCRLEKRIAYIRRRRWLRLTRVYIRDREGKLLRQVRIVGRRGGCQEHHLVAEHAF